MSDQAGLKDITVTFPCRCSVIFYAASGYRGSQITPCPEHTGKGHEETRAKYLTLASQGLKRARFRSNITATLFGG